VKANQMRIALIGAMALLAVPAQARDRQQRANDDAETARSANRIFGEIDSNHDGRITRDEGLAYIAGQRVSRGNRERIWRALDADRNGWISRQEFVTQAIRYQRQMEIR